MANMLNSGYLSAAVAVVFSTGQTLNALTDNEWTDLSDEIDNGATGKFYPFADLFMELGSITTPAGSDAGIEVYIVPADRAGTGYPVWTGNVTTDQPENDKYFADFLALKNNLATTAQNVESSPQARIVLPQGKFKFAVRSRANVTLNATNTLYYRPYTLASA